MGYSDYLKEPRHKHMIKKMAVVTEIGNLIGK